MQCNKCRPCARAGSKNRNNIFAHPNPSGGSARLIAFVVFVPFSVPRAAFFFRTFYELDQPPTVRVTRVKTNALEAREGKRRRKWIFIFLRQHVPAVSVAKV